MAFRRVDIAGIVENVSNVTNQRALVNQSIQIALDRVFEFHDWPYYIQDRGVIQTTDDYSTGTVSITNGSTTVTGTGTTFTSGMVGRKIRFSGANPFYRILTFVSATEITLEYAYQGTTDSAATYNVYKDEYRLNADVDKYKILRQAQNNIVLFSYHPTAFDERHPMPSSLADPYYEVMEGSLLDTYTTGTISGTVNTSVITGSSTSWATVEGLGRLSKIIVGSGTSRNVYTIKSVDSATQITIFEILSAAIAASTSYEISLNNLRVQLYQIPNAQRLLYYRYFRQPSPLANDYDLPDMPYSFHWVLIYGALSIILMQKGDMNKAQVEAEARFIDGLTLMKLKLGSFTPDRIYNRESIDRLRLTSRGALDAQEPSTFPYRYNP